MVRSRPAGIARYVGADDCQYGQYCGVQYALVRTDCRMSHVIFSGYEQLVLRKIPYGLSSSVPQKRGHEPLERL